MDSKLSSKIGLPDSIIKEILRKAPFSVCLQLSKTCKEYHQLMLAVRGCPITKATFVGHGSTFEMTEEDSSELSFKCGYKCFSRQSHLDAMRTMNLDNCELVFLDMKVEQVQEMIRSVRCVHPRLLTFERCQLSLDSFTHLLSLKKIKGINITHTEVYPPPDFDFILNKTRYSVFICLKIDNMVIPNDAGYRLMWNWNRRVELESFKLYNLPDTVSLTEYLQFIDKYYCEISVRFTFAYAKNIGRKHLKNCVHQLDAADIRGDIGFAYEHHDKLQFLPIFMFLKMRDDEGPQNTCYAVTTLF